MKYLLYSLSQIIISRYHWTLNKFSKRIKATPVIYSEYDFNSISTDIRKKVPGKILIQPNSFYLSSFVKRINTTTKFSFNNIIKHPFNRICFNKKQFKNTFFKFMKNNFNNFLSKNKKIKTIVAIDEFSVPNYSLIAASKYFENCKVVALQHGIIHENHFGYIFPKSEKKEHFFPNALISYGEYEKQLLTKKSIWKPDSIIPLGCPRYDFIKKIKPNKTLRNKLKIEYNKKILFWPTQTHDELMTENGEWAASTDAVFKAMKNNPEWFLLIKLHPGENVKFSLKFYQKYKSKYKVSNVEILEFSQMHTFDSVALSDAVITKHSTVGLEALLMNKPVINLELKKSWDLSQFKELKSNLIVKKASDLNTFLKIIQTNKYKELFEKEVRKYISKHFSNWGNATNKISQLIKNGL